MFFKKRIIRKYREKLLKIKNQNKEKILSQKLEFSKILNHDIKTVVLAQENCLNMILKENFGKITKEQSEIINQILSSNKFLIEIINNSIYLAQIEEKTADLNYENIDIVNQATSCFKDIQYLIKDKNQRFILKTNNNNKINLSGDRKLIQKIISNILAGSVSYGFEKSDIVVTIEENDKEISFYAKNKSLYMTKEKINGIFDTKRTSNDFNQLGMKLNLNVAKKLVDAHHWKFVLKSDKEDESSTFGFVVKKG